MTNGFTFFPNYAEAVVDLSDRQRLEFYDGLVAAGIYGQEPDVKDKVVKALLTVLMPTLNKSVTRMEAGRLGGQKSRKTKAKQDVETPPEKPSEDSFAYQAKSDLLIKQNENSLPSKNDFASKAKEEEKEEEIEKEKETTPLPPSGDKAAAAEADFEKFWKEYPEKRRSHKTEAMTAYSEVNGDGKLTDAILKSLSAWKASEEWSKEDGKYIPLPANYLLRRRFDETPAKRTGSKFASDGEQRKDGWKRELGYT